MDRRIDRRRALGALGAAGLGTLVAACGGGGDGAGGEDGNGDEPPSAGSSTTTSSATSSAAGAGGSSDLAGRFDDAATCALSPEQTEGPFYIDVDSIRGDITDGQDGVPLRLGIRVLDDECAPVPDAVVEVWHCDARGRYSGFEDAAPGAGASGDERYLRGGQVTDRDGIVAITTIYPGWYPGRTTHVHAKAHVSNAEVLTTQLYFDDDVSARVHGSEPYEAAGEADTTNGDDGIFSPDTVMTLAEEGDGWLGLITLTVATP
jgi:protocatechuate 3,4-dioxygenase beta subunit